MKRFMELENSEMLSIDVETNGLWGQAFIIAALHYDKDGNEVGRFVGRCPIAGEVNPWVKDNVLPTVVDIEENYEDYESLLREFIKFITENKQAVPLVHMGHIVEVALFRDAFNLGIISEFGAPYLWYDVCLLFGDSVDTYIKENRISVESNSGTHDPIYDAEVTYKSFRHFISNNVL